MLDIDKLRAENEAARKEIYEYYEANHWTVRMKEHLAESKFFSKLSNIKSLFLPDYDNVEYGTGDMIVQYFIFVLFSFIGLCCSLKLGYDYEIYPIVLGVLLLFHIYIIKKWFNWQAVITNLLIFFFAVYHTNNIVYNAAQNNFYTIIEITENVKTSNDMFEHLTFDVATEYINKLKTNN